ncbi:MAG: heme-degrading domain-containing protein [Clostridiaceae bacterium]|nr:heme-degrading domain-containing protein [Clostridiaceae bacterium]
MENLKLQLEEIEDQEKNLVFTRFDCSEALNIGLRLIEKGKNLSKGITIDIMKNGHHLFHYSFEGTSPDNDEWIKRKNNVVTRFYKSSFNIGLKLKLLNKSIEEKYFLSPNEYAPYGGSFPIIIKDTGVIGTITVSGLSQEEDHNLVVETIREYLES